MSSCPSHNHHRHLPIPLLFPFFSFLSTLFTHSFLPQLPRFLILFPSLLLLSVDTITLQLFDCLQRQPTTQNNILLLCLILTFTHSHSLPHAFAFSLTATHSSSFSLSLFPFFFPLLFPPLPPFPLSCVETTWLGSI